MSERRVHKTWKTGSVRGYNGDGIVITANYTVPPKLSAPEVADIRFFDNSVAKSGPFSRLRSYPIKMQEWTDIPLPDAEGVSGEGINEGFTLVGQIRVEQRDSGSYLRVRFKWGEHGSHSEVGYVLRFDLPEDSAEFALE